MIHQNDENQWSNRKLLVIEFEVWKYYTWL